MNWHDIDLLDRVVTTLNQLGYKIAPAKYGRSEIGVYPLEDKNPLYSRDAEIYAGTLEQIACWMRGVQHQDGYLKMLKATSDKRIKELEEKYVKSKIQKGMLEKIKNPDKKLDKNTEDLIKLRAK
jgi:hypothetical protein